MFEFSVDKEGLIVLVQAMDMYLERWPGGDAEQQQQIKDMGDVLHRALLEAAFYDG
tara:strand:- start:2541 stop:2708 length:168 start_codon:yes stop_codon:yes gene_type:complete